MKTGFALFLLIVTACFAAAENKKPATIVELFGENLEFITKTEKMDTCVLRYAPPPQGAEADVASYYETDFVAIPADYANVVRSALLQKSTYSWKERDDLCSPRYQTRVRFHRQGQVLNIDFCFTSNNLLIHRDGKVIAVKEFSQPVFLETMLALFPDNNALTRS